MQIIDFLRKSGVTVDSVSIRKPSLGDVFLHYTGREIREEAGSAREGMRRLARLRR